MGIATAAAMGIATAAEEAVETLTAAAIATAAEEAVETFETHCAVEISDLARMETKVQTWDPGPCERFQRGSGGNVWVVGLWRGETRVSCRVSTVVSSAARCPPPNRAPGPGRGSRVRGRVVP